MSHDLFLHGLAGDPEDWDQALALLPPYQAHAPRVDFFYGHETLESLAHHVQTGTLTQGGSSGRLVVGNSLGGMLALALGHQYQRIVLVASHVRTEKGLLGRGQKTVHREIARIFHDPTKLTPAQIYKYEQKWEQFTSTLARFRRLRALKGMIERFNPEPLYERLQHKLTFICGAQDKISPLGDFEAIQKRYPAITLRVIDSCGHAIPLERVNVLVKMLTQELENTSKTSTDKFFTQPVLTDKAFPPSKGENTVSAYILTG